MYSSFDALGKNQFDWRLFASMLHFLQNPHLNCEDHLKWAFHYFVGGTVEEIDSPCKGKIRLGNLHLIFKPFLCSEKIDELSDDLDNAWLYTRKNIGSLDTMYHIHHGLTNVSFNRFEVMLKHERLLRKSWNKKSFTAWTNAFEEQ